MDLRIESRRYDDPDVTRLVAQVQAEYVELYGSGDDAVVDVGEFDPPTGVFLVGVLDGVPSVTGGWRRLDQTTVEIKRMFVVRAARRRGLGRLMLADLEASAAAAGATRIVLNTGVMQPAAVAMYECSGYTAIPGYGYYAAYASALFYGKDVGRLEGWKNEYGPSQPV